MKIPLPMFTDPLQAALSQFINEYADREVLLVAQLLLDGGRQMTGVLADVDDAVVSLLPCIRDFGSGLSISNEGAVDVSDARSIDDKAAVMCLRRSSILTASLYEIAAGPGRDRIAELVGIDEAADGPFDDAETGDVEPPAAARRVTRMCGLMISDDPFGPAWVGKSGLFRVMAYTPDEDAEFLIYSPGAYRAKRFVGETLAKNGYDLERVMITSMLEVGVDAANAYTASLAGREAADVPPRKDHPIPGSGVRPEPSPEERLMSTIFDKQGTNTYNVAELKEAANEATPSPAQAKAAEGGGVAPPRVPSRLFQVVFADAGTRVASYVTVASSYDEAVAFASQALVARGSGFSNLTVKTVQPLAGDVTLSVPGTAAAAALPPGVALSCEVVEHS